LSSIVYYITGHGYGHAVRSNLVIQALMRAAPGLKIHVRTTAPQWLFHGQTAPVVYSSQGIDVGILQRDSLEMDLEETLRACRALHEKTPLLIKKEIEFIREHGICLILGDIPPIAFEIAARADIPSIALTNFTWSWIYRAYLEAYPAFLPLIEEMESFYRKATLALTLPYSGNLKIFPTQESIPWVARTSQLDKRRAKAKFGLPDSLPSILLSFGGLGLKRLPWEKLKQLGEYYFVTTGGESTHLDGNLLVRPDAQRRYQDLVRAADVVVTKPGYGIVADVLAHQTPILYTDRGEFPEYPHLVQALSDLATAEFIRQDDLLFGDIAPSIARLLNKEQHWPAVPLNGAEVAAKRIVGVFDQSR
jgi:UDP:flavonoid glycosyltransferase YjiC (YdhE family)